MFDTGALVAEEIQLRQAVVFTVAEGSTVGSGGVGFNVDSLSLGPESVLYFGQDVIDMTANNLVLLYQSSLQSQSDQKQITITANTLTIYDFAAVDVSEGGHTAGDGEGSASSGATYGGQGGGSDVAPWGSVTDPDDFGSGCSSNRGGGKLLFNVAEDFYLYGTLAANGQDGDSGYGGASGGSIVVNANRFAGHGDIKAYGGDSTVGGGGGGRVAINAPSYDFIGAISIKGGTGADSDTNGASGTEYRSFTLVGTDREQIRADNEGTVAVAYTGITDGLDSTQVKLEITGNAVIKMLSATQTEFTLQNIVGDFTGLLYVQNSQTLALAQTSGIQSPYALPTKVHVEEGGICGFSPKLMLKDPVEDGDRTVPNLYMAGKMKFVVDLYVGERGQVTFTETANTENGPLLTDPGTIKFTTLNVINSGELKVGLDSTDMFTIDTITETKVHYGGIVYGRNLKFVSTEVSISYQGEVTVDGQGHANTEGDAAGADGGAY